MLNTSQTPRARSVPRSILRVVLILVAVSLNALMPAGARQQQQQPSVDDTLAIVGATVVDGTGREPFRGTVLVRGGRIAAVGREVETPAGARVVRAEGRTLVPGLFDLHTHLPYATAPGITGDWPKNLKAYLYCGVTSVVEFGTYPETFEPMRRLVSTGAVEGPRIHFAARMSTPGGHGVEGGRGDLFTLEVQTPREARAAVRRVLPYKPDAIKVFTDGWRYNTAPDMTSMNEQTLAAIVEEAHRNNVEVLTHTVTLERAKVAARAGVDVIAHGVGDRAVDEELVGLMRAKGTTYVSTLAVYEPRGRDILTPLLSAVLEPAVRAQVSPPLTEPPAAGENVGALPPEPTAATGASANEVTSARAARRARWANLLGNVRRLKEGGVRLGAGTDAGVTGTHHGWATLRELRLLVAGGLTPLEAISAATLESARALRVESERGSIEVGKLADLVLFDGEPHRDIADIERVARVFLGGREIDRERLARDIAAAEQTPLPSFKVGERVDDFEIEGANTNEGRARQDGNERDRREHDGRRRAHAPRLAAERPRHALGQQHRRRARPLRDHHGPHAPAKERPRALRPRAHVRRRAPLRQRQRAARARRGRAGGRARLARRPLRRARRRRRLPPHHPHPRPARRRTLPRARSTPRPNGRPSASTSPPSNRQRPRGPSHGRAQTSSCSPSRSPARPANSAGSNSTTCGSTSKGEKG